MGAAHPAVEAIASALSIGDAPAKNIRTVLEENTGSTQDDYYSREPDEEDEFSEESHYAEKDTDATDLYLNWLRFKKSLRTETRLFSSSAQVVLDSIFSDLDGHATRKGRPEIPGPSTPKNSQELNGQKIARQVSIRVSQTQLDLVRH
jgi:hypothetical protein